MILKRAVDLLVSSIALLLLAPLMLAIALAVRVSSAGPILFRQRRLGLHGRPFELYKFRTMYPGSPDLRNSDGSSLSPANDPRVTGAGRILRSASLDELPQLMNVLRGEMSLIGPRPDQEDQAAYYTEREKRKLSVKPGLTGLAQVSGRNRVSWRERKALDVEYAERQCFRLDLSILLRTIPCVLLRKDVNNGVTGTGPRTVE